MLVLHELRRLREQRIMSQRDLAAKAGVSPTTVIRAEKGEPMRYISVRKLAAALGVDPSALLGSDSESKEGTERG
jgi:transcriptional regulator with XRE-family HTH domain